MYAKEENSAGEGLKGKALDVFGVSCRRAGEALRFDNHEFHVTQFQVPRCCAKCSAPEPHRVSPQ
jgi:hypothetical protein